MKGHLVLASAALALALAGCASNGNGGVTLGGQNSVVGDAVTIGKNDIAALYATAKANPQLQVNRLLVKCIPTFETWVGTFPLVNGSIQVAGLASGIEAGAVIINGIEAPIPDNVYEDCGGVLMKGRVDIFRLAAGIGVTGLKL